MKITGLILMSTSLLAFMPNSSAKSEHPTAVKYQQSIQTNQVIKSVKPNYPIKALREQIEGKVELLVNVDEQGNVADVEVVHAQPKRIFEDAAIDSMKKWHFKKKIVDGQARPYQVSQTIEFELVNYINVNGQFVPEK